MSGIFAYIGREKPQKVLLDGLKMMQHRGGEVNGITVCDKSGFVSVKTLGGIDELADSCREFAPSGNCGIAKTALQMRCRGASSAVPASNQLYAAACDGEIRNFNNLKQWTRTPFPVYTDDDLLLACLCITHIESKTELCAKISAALSGAPSFAFIQKDENALYANAGNNCLFVGVSESGCCVSSELSALAGFERYAVLTKGETVKLRTDKTVFFDSKGKKIKKSLTPVTGRFFIGSKTLLTDEIHGCSQAAREVYSEFITNSKICFDSLKMSKRSVEKMTRIILVGEGSSYHAAVYACCLLETLTDIPSASYPAGEFMFSRCVLDKNTLVIAVSHRGETDSVLNCIRRAKAAGAKTLAVTGSKISSLSFLCDKTVSYNCDYTDGVSLRSFIYSSMTLSLFALYIGVLDSVVTDIYLNVALKMAEMMSGKIASAIKENTAFAGALKLIFQSENVFTCAVSTDFSAALETADKMRALAAVNCAAVNISELVNYPKGMLENAAVLAFVTGKDRSPQCEIYLSRLRTIGAKVVLFTTENIEEEMTAFDSVISVNDTLPIFNPLPCVAAGYRLAMLIKLANLQQNGEQEAS